MPAINSGGPVGKQKICSYVLILMMTSSGAGGAGIYFLNGGEEGERGTAALKMGHERGMKGNEGYGVEEEEEDDDEGRGGALGRGAVL